jgi:hypothetical protein
MTKPLQHRDGTSQAGRIQKALAPEYIRVDERSIGDLFEFARKYSSELRYFNDDNKAEGDWSDFLKENNLDEIMAYISDPERFLREAEKKNTFIPRPHLILFITFLELLQHARAQLNDLTRRHLEFYYREALQLTSQQELPDHVHVLVELANGQGEFLVPAGTLFKAGQDSQGNDLFYRSDEDLVANQASVSSIKSLFAEKKVIGIREARQDPDTLIELFSENTDVPEEGARSYRSFMAMLVMALGTPSPGGKLESYPDNRTVNESLLAELDWLLQFIHDRLYMSISTFRSLVQLKNDLLVVKDQEKLISQQWKQINDNLENAGRRRDPEFILDKTEKFVPDNFEQNLLSAFGDLNFSELPDVDNIYDLYRNKDRDDVKAFIGESNEGDSVKIGPSLYMSVEDFGRMMESVEEINGRWRQVYEILRGAGKKKYKNDPDHVFEAPLIRTYDPNKFDNLVQRTLGEIGDPIFRSFDDSYSEIMNLENYFHTSAEKFAFIRKINAMPEQEVQPWEWDQMDAILEDARREKILVDRRKVLKTKKESDGFDAMILFALGEPGDVLPDFSKKFLELDSKQDGQYIQKSFFLTPENFDYIKKNSPIQPNDPKWENIYDILEQAQRRKRKWEAPRTKVEKWENVYVAADARQVQVQVGAGGGSDSPRWRTFGEGYHQDGPIRTLPGNIGFAITSPLLTLAEGERIVTLTLDFNKDGFDKDAIGDAIKGKALAPFRFLLSTEKEMIAIEQVKIESVFIPLTAINANQTCQLKFTLTLDAQVPPITGRTTANGINTALPQLQILLADIQEKEKAPRLKRYRAFQSLKLEKIHLQVEVDGITDLVLQNDDGVLDSKTPFTPFGSSPAVGSSFYFAHAELCSKKLDELRLNIDWLGAPVDFTTYYSGYPIAPHKTDFKAKLRLYDNRSFFDLTTIPLFDNSKVSFVNKDGKNIFSDHKPDIYPVSAPKALDWRRYWQLELLDPDFHHAIYPKTAADNAIKSISINPPYTPKIKKLSAGYTASLEIDLKENRSDTKVDYLYHIEPFGYRNLPANKAKVYSFLPLFENEGELFIGIKDLVPPQNLSLLFQMAPGSADPDVEQEPIYWSYLDRNQWKTLEKGQLLGDTTNGLLNSGIIKFSLAPVEPSTLLPAGFYWIRAAIAKNSRSAADTVAIKAQAVSATSEDHGNAPDHLSQSLPAESIHGLVESVPQVKAIHQPYSSYGGKSPEQAGKFYTRVSERLRHKDRALTSWDYEHMVLEAFPGIYKVKCLPVGSSEDPHLSDVVQVVVIPDIRGKLPFDPFEPKAPADVLWQIEQYLLKRSPPYSQLKVKNPTYVRIRVRLSVRFREGNNPGYYQDALNRELQQYLAPWAYDQSADIFFGGTINTSLIINFVEERPYIDYVAGIKIFTSLDDHTFTLYDPEATEPQAIFAPDAILVSDRSHVIDLITEEGFEEEFFTGINYMEIELDFKVGGKEFFIGIDYMEIGLDFKVG